MDQEFTVSDFVPDKDEFSLDDFQQVETEPKVELSPYEKLRMQGIGPGIGATTGPAHPEEIIPLYESLVKPPVEIPRIEGKTTIGKIGAGVANVAGGIYNTVVSPVGLATLPIGGTRLGAALLKGVFGGLAAKEAGRTLGEASVTGDPQAYTEGLLSAAMAPAIALPGSLPKILKSPEESLSARNRLLEAGRLAEQASAAISSIPRGITTEALQQRQAAAFRAGREAANSGKSKEDNPYIEHSPEQQAWDRGFTISNKSLKESETPNAPQERFVKESVPGKRAGDDQVRTSPEAGSGGGLQPETGVGQETQVPLSTEDQSLLAKSQRGEDLTANEEKRLKEIETQQVELRHSGIPIPGSEKFVEEDVKPFVKEVADTIGETASQVKNLLSPATAGPEAKTAAGVIREHKAQLAQTDEQMRAKFDDNRKAFDKLTPQQSLDFINRMERGLAQTTPELDTLQQSLRDELDSRVTEVRAVNPNALQHLIQDYFPHLWKDPTAAASWYQRILGRRPLRGPASFLKRRTIPTTADGVNAGLEPVSWNPIDLSLLKFHEMDRYVMGQKIFQEFKDKGLAQFSRSDIPPDGYARINDRVANVIEYRPTTRVSGLPGAPERVLRGHWYVQEDAARVLNNFLSPGLERFKWYRAIRWFGNTMNMAQLGLSGYHFTFTMIDSGTSKLSLGIEQTAQGKPKGLVTMGRGVGGTVLANQLEAYLKGNKVLEEYTEPGSVGGDYAKVVDALLAGGGRVKMPEIFTNSTLKNFFKAIRSGNYPGAVIRAPAAALEAASYPLMQNVVPRLKLGVFTDMALNEIERMGPGVSREEFRATMGKVWDSVDNRMGEMVYDNLFWNKTLKDLSFLAVRAVGWNLGTLRELGGGVVDSASVIKRIREGDPVVTRRMAYLVSLPITVGMMGAMYQYLKTGKGPEELRDYIYPKTGQTLPDGTPERVNFPSYLKDIGAYGRHPLQTLINKLHPTWSTLDQMFRNKDYYGTQIRNPDDPLVKQVGEELQFLGRTFIPFSFKGAQRRVGSKESPEVKAESFFGVMPIPAEIARTTAENKIMSYGIARQPQGARTAQEQQRVELKRDLESQLQNPADYSGAQAEIRKMAREGKLSKGQAAYENTKLKFEQEQIRTGKTKAQAQWLWRFKHLNLDEARAVYEVATPEEKRLFFRELRAKELKAR